MNINNFGNAGSITPNCNISSGNISPVVQNNSLNPEHSSGNTMHDFHSPPTSAPRTGLPTYLLQEITHPIFDNNEFTNPHHFIRDMEEYFKIKDIPHELWMFVVKKGLKGSVLKWLQITMGELNDYVLFKKHFVKHYWGIRQQNQIRIEITQGKYNPKGNMSMIDYFMGIISKAKNLEPAMSDQELISLIIPHFPDHILLKKIRGTKM